MYSVLKPCKTSAAFEAIPRDRFSLDLDLCEEILKEVCTIVVHAGIMLIVSDQCEISIHKDGRLILKTDSGEVAREQTGRIAGWLEGTPAIRKHRDSGSQKRNLQK
ncbi:hypothetical protein [Methanosphaerula palustris]|uniref:Uncharacterized protein n=1 Tax=Methanosphaerula palustris (strain ATCC BAA-1556 / DSM 19958 / E1-9c) TaxID=521011 RepID=B8GKU7_METPE|nr:hypothetical protein [Methanosphaerula palustris]ACL17243.1 conserved hypothetical protein [Methanosphaerula palustris E1-9c]